MSDAYSYSGLAGAIDNLLAAWVGDHSEPNRRVCTAILAGAIGLGLLGDALFNGAGPGLNYPLWLVAFVAVYVFSARLAGTRPDAGRAGLIALGLACAAMVGWRGGEILQALSLLASLACVSLAAAMRPPEGFRRLGILDIWLAAAGVFVSLVAGLPKLLTLVDFEKWWGRRTRANALVFGRALVLATPLVLGFGGLFVAADAVFEERVNGLVQLDLAGVQTHLCWTLGCAWAAGGLLWAGVAVEAPAGIRLEVPDSKRLQTVEVIVVVGSLVALFAAFVVVQVRYLFSGEAPVEHSFNLTYAQYARRGFFELVAAAALLLPVLLAIDWALARRKTTHLAFRALAGVLLILLSAVMLSALERMQVYKDAYGLTELRVYVTAILLWLGAVFLWFAASVLCGRRDRFAAVAILSATLMLLALNVLNPDALIARTNVARAAEGKSFDAHHALTLGPEAVPELIDGLDGLPDSDACTVARGLLDRWLGETVDPRGWNLGRSQAISAVKDNEDRLRAACVS
jgi:hypothetical protein